jgi:signal transduction histidine kinase
MSHDPIQTMGTLTTMTTHELQNVLAIIRESAGLLGDILDANASVRLKHRPKMDEALGHIATQVDRAKKLLDALNRMGHSPDPDVQDCCDLALQAQALLHLCQRPARLKEITLQFTPAAHPLLVQTPALTVFTEGFAFLRALLDVCPSQSCLEISLDSTPEDHRLVARPSSPGDPKPVLDALPQGRINYHNGIFTLTYPVRQP